MESKKLEKGLELDFILGGKAIFTIKNTDTSNRFTFKVTKHKKSNIYFVSVLTSPDIYEFFGTIFENKSFSLSKKSRLTSNAQSVKVFYWMWQKLNTVGLPDIIEFWHEGRCAKCSRPLTVPESLILGFGPECAKSLSQKEVRKSKIKYILEE
jgi:hypothetical protein